jgi:hypothetical protein
MSRRGTAATVAERWVVRLFRVAAAVGAAASVACGNTGDSQPLVNIAANIAQAAAAVTGQDAQFADEATGGHYVGFDTHTYPGTATMRAWKETPGAPYSWVGYYLPSPCHANASWTGKRDTLQAMGWGKTPRRLSASALATLR